MVTGSIFILLVPRRANKSEQTRGYGWEGVNFLTIAMFGRKVCFKWHSSYWCSIDCLRNFLQLWDVWVSVANPSPIEFIDGSCRGSNVTMSDGPKPILVLYASRNSLICSQRHDHTFIYEKELHQWNANPKCLSCSW